MLKYILLAALVFSVGCVTQEQGSSLSVILQSDPPVVFENSVARVHVDVTNQDTKRLENVKVQIFSSGVMSFVNEPACVQSGDFKFLLPQEFRTFSCSFRAPKINQDRVTSKLDAKATFDATLSAVRQMELMTEEEYNNRLASSGIAQKPQSYTYSDRNIQLQVDFSEPLPVVIKQGRKFFVKFTVRNIGSGFINALEPQDVELVQKGSLDQEKEGNVLQSINARGEYEPCRLQETISPIGKDFPSFACQILMPANVNVLTNYNVIISIRYHYEIRDSVTVDVIR